MNLYRNIKMLCNTLIKKQSELLRLVPRIKRARGWRLYTEDGKRLVDLWQYGGKALLGHKPANIVRDIKNSAEKGLFAPFNSACEGRLERALARLFPGKEARFYTDRLSLREAFDAGGGGLSAETPVLWRPYRDEKNPFAFSDMPDVFSPVIPFPLSPEILVIEKKHAEKFPPSDIIAPPLLAATTRAIYDLLAAPARAIPYCSGAATGGFDHRFCSIVRYEAGGVAGGLPPAEGVAENPQGSQRGGDFPLLPSFPLTWRREGIYIYIDAPDDYRELFKKFLDGGFLIPPEPQEPLILPGELSAGEGLHKIHF
jgi:hypothetical protein